MHIDTRLSIGISYMRNICLYMQPFKWLMPRGVGGNKEFEREKKLCALCNEFGRMSEKLFCICEAYILYIYHQFVIHYDIWRDFFRIVNLKNSLVWNPKSNWLAFISCIIKAYFDQKFWHALDFGLRLRLTTTPPTSDAAAPSLR